MLEKYSLNNGLTIHKAGRLWSDTTMIDLFFVIFVFLRFFKIRSQMYNTLTPVLSLELAIGRTTRLSHPTAMPTNRPSDWSAEEESEDELSAGTLNRMETDAK
jgi:hypothetical protein